MITTPQNLGDATTFIMDKFISADDAKGRVARLLRDVREGQSYIVTSRGKAIARIAPVVLKHDAVDGAKAALLTRLRSERIIRVGRLRRESLYE